LLEKSMDGDERSSAASTASVGVGASGKAAEATFIVDSPAVSSLLCAARTGDMAKKMVNPIVPMKTFEHHAE
jgi:hypothetical protein